MSEVVVKGMAELQAFLNSVPAKMEANVLRAALRKGANVIRDDARTNLGGNGSTQTGALAKGLKVSTNSKKGVVSATVRATGRHAHIAKWLEYGVAAHSIKKGANRKRGILQTGQLHPGFTEKPFLRPALDTRAAAALVAVGESIKERLATKHGLDTSEVEIEIA